MGTVEKIALRNLREHKAKSLIIGVLIAVGIMVLVLSNSILDSADEGAKKAFIENYTGHLLVSKKLEKGTVTAFGVEGQGLNFGAATENPTIPEYTKVYEYLNSIPEAVSVNSQNAGMGALIKFSEGFEEGAFGMYFGIDPESYINMFPDNIDIIKGEFLESNKQGLMLNQKVIEDIKKEIGREVKVGDTITLQATGGSMRIHEVELKGIFKYKNANSSVAQMNLIDVESYRILAKMIVGTTDVIDVEDDEIALLDDDFDFDTMFDEEIEVADVDSDVNFDNVLGDLSQRDALTKPSTGTWSYILLKLENLGQVDKVKADIEAWAEDNQLDLEVKTWENSAGMTGDTVKVAKVIILILIMIVSVVTVIIIMNTLVVSIIERTTEIGTMRAIGANKGFVRRLFVAETLTISMVFGVIGIILGAILVAIFNKVGISFQGNLLFESIFAGEALYPVLDFMTVLTGLIVSFLIGIFSSFYPVSVALKISPIKAIQG